MLCTMVDDIRHRMLLVKSQRGITFRVIAQECRVSHETLRQLASDREPGHIATWYKIEAWLASQEKELCDAHATASV